MDRPFYTTYAWAYDFLIPGPVKERIEFIELHLHSHQILPGAVLLDAGCGTGNYAIALAKKGFTVIAIDSSSELIAEARHKPSQADLHVNYLVGDILMLPTRYQFDAILCRGVLNDLIITDERRGVFSSFAKAMRIGGILMLDVREWESTVARKTSNPITEKTLKTEMGQLVFRSITTLQPETHSMLISETHELRSSGGREMDTFNFVMRCWTREEVGAYLSSSGYNHIEYFGDYDTAKPIGSTDRLVVVARLERKVDQAQ